MDRSTAEAIKEAMAGLGMEVGPSPLAKFNTECMGAWHAEIKHNLPGWVDPDEIRNEYLRKWTEAKPGQYHVYVSLGGVEIVPQAEIFTGEGVCVGHCEKLP